MSKITNKSLKTQGLEIDNKWYSAKECWIYAEKLNKGDEVEFKINDKGQIYFIKQLNAEFKQSETKENIPAMIRQDYTARQSGIEETARLRRELDLFTTALTLATNLAIAGKINKEQIFEYTKGFINLKEEINKPVNFEIKTEKVI